MLKVGNCKHGTPCVYEIRNTLTNRVYIGSTPRFSIRFTEHKRLLEANKHHSRKLQFSYNKHGASAFVMKVVEVVSHAAFIHAREQYWIERHKFKNTYNSAPVAMGATRIPEAVFSIDPKTGIKTKFDSAMDAAAKMLGASDKPCRIRKAIYSRRRCCGLFWTGNQEESLDAFIRAKQEIKRHRRGYCVFAWSLDGDLVGRFTSITEAATHYGISACRIGVAIRSGFKAMCGSMLWSKNESPPCEKELAERKSAMQAAQIKRREREMEEKRVKVFRKQVIQIDRRTGRELTVFPSLSDAAQAVPKATLNGVSEAANKKRAHHAGFIWEFAKN